MKKWTVALFLLLEAILYAVLLFCGGMTRVAAEFASIVLCFLYVVLHFSKNNLWFVSGLAFTVAADYCLVVCMPIQQLWGMVFFLLAQTGYAYYLHSRDTGKAFLFIRLGLIMVAEAVCILVLKKNTDALALVSVCYYVNLILNLIMAFAGFRKQPLLALGFALFLLCDTVVGLQVAAGGYLPIAEGSLLYRILFMDFHLSWFFYLPSQVLIALYAGKEK